MEVKIVAVITADIPVGKPDVINSDTVGEYVSELNCHIENSALDYISEHLPKADSIEIVSVSVCPYDIDATDEYEQIINRWKEEYDSRSR